MANPTDSKKRGVIGPYAVVPLELLRDPGVTRNMVRVYAALAYHQGANDTAWPSVEKLAETSGVSKGHISENTKSLEALGWITKQRRFSASTIYRVTHPIEEMTEGAASIPGDREYSENANIPGDRGDSIPGDREHSIPGDRGTKTNNEDYQEKSSSALSSRPEAQEVLGYLNQKAGRSFRQTKSSLKNIRGRLSEGYTVDDLKAVIDDRVRKWSSDPKMADYLRPQTLFGPEKFDSYLQAAKTQRIAAGGIRERVCPHCGAVDRSSSGHCLVCFRDFEEAAS